MSKVLSRWKRPLRKGKLIRTLLEYPKYIRDMKRYSKLEGAEPIKFVDTYPCLHDRVSKTSIDSHYFYQKIWAFKKIHEAAPKLHVDVGSDVNFVGLLTVITMVHFIDVRPLDVSNLANFQNVEGDILHLPYKDDSLESISCLHVAEHIGLGRYGDPLDPHGTKKAAMELTRCLAPGGNLYFSVPVGKPRICFNAHRISSVSQILDYFPKLKLVEFSGTNDKKEFLLNADMKEFETTSYACGMFWFRKERLS